MYNIKFIQGNLNQENLDRIKERGAVPSQIFLGKQGELYVLAGEGFGNFDLKNQEEEERVGESLIYDLEKRIREINGEEKD